MFIFNVERFKTAFPVKRQTAFVSAKEKVVEWLSRIQDVKAVIFDSDYPTIWSDARKPIFAPSNRRCE